PSGLDTALLGAAAFGVVGAVPATDATRWGAQALAAAAELQARIAKLGKLASGFTRTTANPDQSRDFETARLKTMFGDAFVVLPALSPDIARTWPRLWEKSASLQAGHVFASVRWVQRAARARSGAARLDTALLYAETLGSGAVASFNVAQLPVVEGDRW